VKPAFTITAMTPPIDRDRVPSVGDALIAGENLAP
jgi:hypothetical protein